MLMQTSPDASSAPSPAIDVAVVEDQREIRLGLTALIDRTPGFRSVGSYRSMEEAIDGIAHRVPRVVLCDIGLPGMSGLEGIKILKAKHPSLQVLMLTVYDDEDRIFEALCAGATGYLLKKTPPARLIESLREAVDGGSPISPEVARRVITLFRDVRPPQRADYELREASGALEVGSGRESPQGRPGPIVVNRWEVFRSRPSHRPASTLRCRSSSS